MEPNFSCTQEVEILIAKTVWTSCLAYQARFVTFSPRYTLVYINGKITLVDTVEAIPNEQQLQNTVTTAHINLQANNTIGCEKWQLLKRYIIKAYREDLQQTNLNAAGMANYQRAYDENWQSSKSLMLNGNQFITDHLAELTANDNMPPAFQAEFTTAKTNFDTKLAAFIAAEQAMTNGTGARVTALNNLHDLTMECCLDGQEILNHENEAKKQFIYDQVLALYDGKSAQGYKGNITNELTGLVIENVAISIERTVHATTSNAQGDYKMANVAHAENQTLIFQHPDYVTKTITGNSVEIGVMTTLNIQLTPNP